jgi:hypothetical protein
MRPQPALLRGGLLQTCEVDEFRECEIHRLFEAVWQIELLEKALSECPREG